MSFTILGLTFGVNKWFAFLSCSRFDVLFRWSAVFCPRVEAWSEVGYCKGKRWKTADFHYGPFEVMRVA